MPYCFGGSSIKFQGHTGWKIDDLNPIWVRLLGRSQLSNPSDFPCFFKLLLYRFWLSDGNPPVTVGFPSQRANNAELWFCWFTEQVVEQWVKIVMVMIPWDLCDIIVVDIVINSCSSFKLIKHKIGPWYTYLFIWTLSVNWSIYKLWYVYMSAEVLSVNVRLCG